MVKRGTSLPILLACVLMASPATAGGFDDRAKRLVSGIFEAASAAVAQSKSNPGDPGSPLNRFIAKHIATQALARFSAGHYWRRSSKEQQARFHTLFRGYM